MKLQLTLEVSEDDFDRCIVAGCLKRHPNIDIDTADIKPFDIGEPVLPSDVENMFLGSCFCELLNETAEMRVVE